MGGEGQASTEQLGVVMEKDCWRLVDKWRKAVTPNLPAHYPPQRTDIRYPTWLDTGVGWGNSLGDEEECSWRPQVTGQRWK